MNAGYQTDRNRGGAPLGNTNAARHGVYSKKLLTPEEEEHFADTTDRLRQDFPSADESLIHETAMYTIRVSRAFNSGNVDALRKMNSKLRKALKKLKSPEPTGSKESHPMTREEWMEGLLARVHRKS